MHELASMVLNLRDEKAARDHALVDCGERCKRIMKVLEHLLRDADLARRELGDLAWRLGLEEREGQLEIAAKPAEEFGAHRRNVGEEEARP